MKRHRVIQVGSLHSLLAPPLVSCGFSNFVNKSWCLDLITVCIANLSARLYLRVASGWSPILNPLPQTLEWAISIQCLNFVKKWFNSIFDSILLNSNYYSFQNKLRWFNSKENSIQKSGNHWYWSNQKSAKKVPKKWQKGGFYQNLKVSIQYMIHLLSSR